MKSGCPNEIPLGLLWLTFYIFKYWTQFVPSWKSLLCVKNKMGLGIESFDTHSKPIWNRLQFAKERPTFVQPMLKLGRVASEVDMWAFVEYEGILIRVRVAACKSQHRIIHLVLMCYEKLASFNVSLLL